MVFQVSPKQDIIFMITKMGYLFMFDIHSGKALYRAKISEQTIFVTTTQVPKCVPDWTYVYMHDCWSIFSLDFVWICPHTTTAARVSA